MAFNYITFQTEDRLAFITLNRPDKRNALNFDFITELKEAMTRAENDNQAKIIILKAEGEAFSAGADLEYLKKLQENSYEENLMDSTHMMELFKLIYTHPKLVIAQVEGPAIAGGCGLATVCDLSFATPDSVFGYSEVKIGFIPAIVMIFLIRKIGEAKAKEMLLTGKIVKAEEAKALGMINFVEKSSTINAAVIQYAQDLCETASSESLARTKKMIAEVQNKTIIDALEYATVMNAKARDTKDCKKGIEAFLNKEDLKW
ncbi:MAG: enoyl-CoA hydratase/isomerase family protein [Bacteroidetes bacterium]|nr:enoyl-CoA hydratase/isomerase family protein [Bacteroidota bacterium]